MITSKKMKKANKIILAILAVVLITAAILMYKYTEYEKTTTVKLYDVSKHVDSVPSNAPTVNGKYFPLWQQLVDNKDLYIGKFMEDIDASNKFSKPIDTKITDILLIPDKLNDTVLISIRGEDFTKVSDVKDIGIIQGDSDWITFLTSSGHSFRIQK